jgi:type IV pilus assembly protein PilO
MAKFTDLPQSAQIGIIVGVVALCAFGYWFVQVKPIEDSNKKDLESLKSKTAEVAQLTPYVNKESDLSHQIENMKQQLELQKRIVPDEKEVPSFITLVQGEAQKSGIEIRRYSVRPIISHEYYNEQPFDLDVDGPYYAVVDFFQRLSQTERIINVGNLAMGGTKAGASPRGVKRIYTWGPNETVVANCTATTFYSNPASAAPPAPAKK